MSDQPHVSSKEKLQRDWTDLLGPPKRWIWRYHPNDWAFPLYLRVAVYGFATFGCAQILCWSVTYRRENP